MEQPINEINITQKLDYGEYKHFTGVYPCGLCGKCFATDDRLNIHLHFHTGDKLFSCKICRKRFPKMIELLSHTKDHRSEKPIKRRTQSRRGTKRL